MKTDLLAFLRDLARKPFSYGASGTDCGRPLADLWMAEHGVDPIAEMRGAYSDRSTCLAFVTAQGHLPRLVARVARRLGAARRRGSYQPGDLAVLRVQRQWFGAIRSGDGYWIVKAHNGVLAMRDCRVAAAWSLT